MNIITNKRMKQMINNINLIYRYFIINDVDDIKKVMKQKIYNVNPKKINDILKKLEIIIEIISKKLNDNWSFKRLDNLHKAILVVAVYDIKYRLIDKNLVINEIVEIAKMFSIDDNYKYINAVLDNI